MYEQDQYDRERLQQNAISRCVKEGGRRSPKIQEVGARRRHLEIY